MDKRLPGCSSRLLKNTHLLRCAHPSSLRRTVKYASFLTISRALHLDVFDQPERKPLFKQPGSMTMVTGKNKGSELLYDAATQQSGRDGLLLRAFTIQCRPLAQHP